MAKPLSKTSLVIRVLLIAVLLVMIGAFILQRRTEWAAQAVYDRARQVVADKKSAADLEQLVGRKADHDQKSGQIREQRYVFKGLIRDYTVRVLFNALDKGEAGEEAHLDVYDKIKGKGSEGSEGMELQAPPTKK